MTKEVIKDHKDSGIYKIAFETAMKIFELSKKFPVEERYSLTDPPGSAVAHGGNPQDRAASPNSSFFSLCMCEHGRSLAKTPL